MSFWNEIVFPSMQKIFGDIVGVLPNLLGALVIFLVGWIIARLVRNLVTKLLDKLGFDQLVERAGMSTFLENSPYARSGSWVIGQMIFWMIMLIVLLTAAESMQMDALANTLQQFVAFVPNLITVAFILVFGFIGSQFLGRLAEGAALNAGMDFAPLAGKLVTYVINIAVVVICITQLRIESMVLNIILASVLGALGLAIALTLGLGTRNISQNIVSGLYVRKLYEIGQRVTVQGVNGKILEIGTITTRIENGSETVILPNRLLIEEVTSASK